MIKFVVGKFGQGITEQALVSFLNFGMVILLSKILSHAEFAHYIVLFSGIVLAYSLSMVMWSNPILVYLQSKRKDSKLEYGLTLSVVNKFWCGLSFFTFRIDIQSPL